MGNKALARVNALSPLQAVCEAASLQLGKPESLPVGQQTSGRTSDTRGKIAFAGHAKLSAPARGRARPLIGLGAN